MADIERNINDIVEDLRTKIDELSNAGIQASGETLTKVNDIKRKAIDVLNQASLKVKEVANSTADSQDIEKSIEIVKEKSKLLYDNALEKISELINPKVTIQVNETAKNIKKEINDFFEKEESKFEQEEAKIADVNIEEKAIETLKSWLKTEEK